MNSKRITVAAEISASPQNVWEYWTNPSHITKWNFASEDWHCPKAENNLIEGGKFMSRMEARDGSAGFDFEGVYDEIVEGKKISYTMTNGRKVTTDFIPDQGGCKVSIVFDADNEFPLEVQETGWQAILNNFKKYAETTEK